MVNHRNRSGCQQRSGDKPKRALEDRVKNTRDDWYNQNSDSIITGPPNGPVLFCTSYVACNAAGMRGPADRRARGRSARQRRARERSGGRQCKAGHYGHVLLGRHLVLNIFNCKLYILYCYMFTKQQAPLSHRECAPLLSVEIFWTSILAVRKKITVERLALWNDLPTHYITLRPELLSKHQKIVGLGQIRMHADYCMWLLQLSAEN